MTKRLNDFIKSHFAKRLDVVFIPFTKCNLSCPFCEETQKVIDFDIKAYTNGSRQLDSILTTIPNDYPLFLDIYGGELFADAVPEENLNALDEFIDHVYSTCKQSNRYVHIDIVSNLVHHKANQILFLKHKYPDLGIVASANVEGQFTKQIHKQLFLSNLQALRSIRDLRFAAVIDKKSKNLLINQVDCFGVRLFNMLYDEGYVIDVEPYIDVRNLDDYKITAEDYAEFIKFAINRYPRLCNMWFYDRSVKLLSKSTEGLAEYTYTIYCDQPAKLTDKQNEYIQMVKSRKCFLCRYNSRCSPRFGTTINKNEFCPDKTIMNIIEINNASINHTTV